MLTKEQFMFIVLHAMIFIVAYAGVMSAAHIPGWFDWTALQAGGAATLGGHALFRAASNSLGSNNSVTPSSDAGVKPNA